MSSNNQHPDRGAPQWTRVQLEDFEPLDSATESHQRGAVIEAKSGSRNNSTTTHIVTIQIGGTMLSPAELENLDTGMLVPLDQDAEELVDINIDGQLVARGEIGIVDGTFCVHVSELVHEFNAIA